MTDFLTVTGLISHLDDAVSTRMLQAKNAGDALLMQAGVQLQQLLDSARFDFDKSSSQAISHTDEAVKRRLEQIQALVNDFVKSVDISAAHILAQSQTIANSLPLVNKRPQLISSSTVVELSSHPVYWPSAITFTGNWLENGKLILTDKRGKQQTVLPSSSSTTRLRFSLYLTDFFDLSSAATTKLQAVDAILSIPFPSSLLGLLYNNNSATFRTQIVGVYTGSVGSIELVYTIHGKKRVEQPFESQNFHVASTRECGNNDQIDKHDQYHAPAG